MTIGRKISLGYWLMWAILAIIGALAFWSLTGFLQANHASLETNARVVQTHEILDKLEELLALMTDAETGQRGYLITGEKPYLEPFIEAKERVFQVLDDLKRLIVNPDVHNRLKELEPKMRERLKILQEGIEVRGQQDKGLDAAIEFVKKNQGKKIMDEIRQIVQDMKTKLHELLTERMAAAAETTKAVEAIARSAMVIIGGGMVLAFLFVAVGGYFIVRSVTRPVREAVASLASASAEILASTTQQATGAQQQAAAVSETVATVDEVTQTADQGTQRAKGVGEAVGRTLEIGKSGRKTVDESIAALGTVKEQVEATAENILALAEQAQAISAIIASVNDIAEQTNLLALNAAIEASRAGEHGRGFAVVAGEVKTLADQSKKATAQVRQILGEIQKATNTAVLSTEEVTKGVAAAGKVADQSGQTIKALADTLGEAAQAATQIVASAGQQATGMAQIHQAMKNIDQVARQNLAAMRQAEQAAQNLNRLGDQLAGLIGQ